MRLFKLHLIYFDDNLSRVFPESGQHLFLGLGALILAGGFYQAFTLMVFKLILFTLVMLYGSML
jgi:hypothetical protein